MTAGELHDALSRLGADLMLRVLAAAGARLAVLYAAAGERRHLCGENLQGRDADRLGQALADRCTTTSAACRRFPAPGSSSTAGASRCCARPKARVAGAPGTVLDDKLTIACGEGAVRLVQVQRAGKQPMSAEEFLRGTPVKAGARVA